MSNSAISVLVKKLEDRKSSIEQFLARGGIKSYEDYMSITGKYQAISDVIEDAKEVEKRFLEE